MSDFLTNLATRTLAQTPAIRPRLGVFEPLRANEGVPLEQTLVYETPAQPASPPAPRAPLSLKSISPGPHLQEPVVREAPAAAPARKPTSNSAPIEVPVPGTVLQQESQVATPVAPLLHPVTARLQDQQPEGDHPSPTMPLAPVMNPEARQPIIPAQPLRLDQDREPGYRQSDQSSKQPNEIAHPPAPASLLVTKPESTELKQTIPAQPLRIEDDPDAARVRPKSDQEPPLDAITAPKVISLKEVQTKELMVVEPVSVPGDRVVRSHPVVDSKPLANLASPRPTKILAQPQVKLNSEQTPVAATNQPVTAKIPPAVHVTIGRIEVRAIATQVPTTARGKSERRATVLSLDDYLKQREGGTRR